MTYFKYITHIFIVFLFFLFISCQKYLEENPTVFASPSEILTNEAGAELYTIGNYAQIKAIASDWDGWLLMWGTIAADEIVIPNWGADIRSIYLHSFTTSNNSILNVWTTLYRSINRVNSGIQKIGAMTTDQIDENAKNKFIAEHKLFKSHALFLFGFQLGECSSCFK